MSTEELEKAAFRIGESDHFAVHVAYAREVAKERDALREAADEIESLRAALQWYADGLHFDKASPDAWDTVSGEPANWWCDEAGTATVEDGTLAGMVLAGQLTGQKLHALKDCEEA